MSRELETAAMLIGELVAMWGGSVMSAREFEAAAKDHKWPFRLAPTGEEFVAMTSGGIKPEGEVMPLWCSTQSDAIAKWFVEMVSALVAGIEVGAPPRSLYWREMPQLVERPKPDPRFPQVDDDTWKPWQWVVYSRLLFSIRTPTWQPQ
jgi:hypothetical protein